MKKPVGPLGMTDEERANFIRTEKWPERMIDVPDRPAREPVPDLRFKEEEAKALRDYWRSEGRWEGLKEGQLKADEALRRARKLMAEETGQKLAKRGRPSSRADEAAQMLKILDDNRDRDERYCRALFENSLKARNPTMKKSAVLDHSRRALSAAQKLRPKKREER